MRAERDAAEDRVDKMMESARGQADNILKNARMTAETVFDELETLKKKAQKKNDRPEPRGSQGGAARCHHPNRERTAPRHPEARCRG